ncbi:MAG TPA: hypothetical protein VN452_00500 [Longilinea sp.]|nr:hypothetical protein [Longilinea sp.]
MTGVFDPVIRAEEVKKANVSLVLYHRSIDEETTIGARWDEKACNTVGQLAALGMDVAIAGGVNLDVIPLLEKFALYGIVVGKGITAQADPAKAASDIHALVHRIWNK